jgi:hypothetical protein
MQLMFPSIDGKQNLNLAGAPDLQFCFCVSTLVRDHTCCEKSMQHDSYAIICVKKIGSGQKQPPLN